MKEMGVDTLIPVVSRDLVGKHTAKALRKSCKTIIRSWMTDYNYSEIDLAIGGIKGYLSATPVMMTNKALEWSALAAIFDRIKGRDLTIATDDMMASAIYKTLASRMPTGDMPAQTWATGANQHITPLQSLLTKYIGVTYGIGIGVIANITPSYFSRSSVLAHSYNSLDEKNWSAEIQDSLKLISSLPSIKTNDSIPTHADTIGSTVPSYSPFKGNNLNDESFNTLVTYFKVLYLHQVQKNASSLVAYNLDKPPRAISEYRAGTAAFISQMHLLPLIWAWQMKIGYSYDQLTRLLSFKPEAVKLPDQLTTNLAFIQELIGKKTDSAFPDLASTIALIPKLSTTLYGQDIAFSDDVSIANEFLGEAIKFQSSRSFTTPKPGRAYLLEREGSVAYQHSDYYLRNSLPIISYLAEHVRSTLIIYHETLANMALVYAQVAPTKDNILIEINPIKHNFLHEQRYTSIYDDGPYSTGIERYEQQGPLIEYTLDKGFNGFICYESILQAQIEKRPYLPRLSSSTFEVAKDLIPMSIPTIYMPGDRFDTIAIDRNYSHVLAAKMGYSPAYPFIDGFYAKITKFASVDPALLVYSIMGNFIPLLTDAGFDAYTKWKNLVRIQSGLPADTFSMEEMKTLGMKLPNGRTYYPIIPNFPKFHCYGVPLWDYISTNLEIWKKKLESGTDLSHTMSFTCDSNMVFLPIMAIPNLDKLIEIRNAISSQADAFTKEFYRFSETSVAWLPVLSDSYQASFKDVYAKTKEKNFWMRDFSWSSHLIPMAHNRLDFEERFDPKQLAVGLATKGAMTFINLNQHEGSVEYEWLTETSQPTVSAVAEVSIKREFVDNNPPQVRTIAKTTVIDNLTLGENAPESGPPLSEQTAPAVDSINPLAIVKEDAVIGDVVNPASSS